MLLHFETRNFRRKQAHHTERITRTTMVWGNASEDALPLTFTTLSGIMTASLSIKYLKN